MSTVRLNIIIQRHSTITTIQLLEPLGASHTQDRIFARVRRGLIQLAWRFLMFQKDSALARWYRTRTEGPSGARKTTMIVALARKLLIALWRLATTGEVPDGVELRPAA
jgi:hypothetical protein